jgi:hypothetical protein
MRQEEPGLGGPLGAFALLRKFVTFERPQGLAPDLPGAGTGRAGRRPCVRPRPGADDGPAARRPGPPSTHGNEVCGGCRADGRRRRGEPRCLAAGQRPDRPPDATRPGIPQACAAQRRRAAMCAGPGPALQAPRRRRAEAVPDARKNRIAGCKFLQETGRRAPPYSVRVGNCRIDSATPL